MVMINTKRISKEYGDSTADYEILMDQEYTVEEFINDVLKIYPNNWGEFLISDNPDSFFSAHIEEREISGRQKIVRGSNVPVLASHAGLNPRSKSGCEREAQVINSNFAILRDNYVTDRIYENQGIGSAGLFYVHQLAKQLHCSYIEGVKHPVKVKKDERKDEMDRLTYFYQKNGYKQESGNARIYMKL